MLVLGFIGQPDSWLNPYLISLATGIQKGHSSMANWLWFTRVHRALYRGTRGLIGGNLIGIHMLLLTTTGRKSGTTRTLPLTYVADRGDFLIVASNGGSEKPPAWWLNLSDKQTAEIQVGGERFPVTWELVTPEERIEVWRKLQAAIPAYRIYRHRTLREIPIVRLKRLTASWQTRPLVGTEAPDRLDPIRASGSECAGS
jgi:deazaflavin-dependent oxidoreductase (nitroreductase family)